MKNQRNSQKDNETTAKSYLKVQNDTEKCENDTETLTIAKMTPTITQNATKKYNKYKMTTKQNKRQ